MTPMVTGGRTRRAEHLRARALRRRRLWAGAAVVACIAADVWSVTWAGAREPQTPSALSVVSAVALTAGTGPLVHVDAVETVPSSPLLPGSDADAGGRRASSSGSSTGSSSGTSSKTSTSPKKVVEKGDGRFTLLPIPADALRDHVTTGRVVSYTLEVEGGLGIDRDEYARTVVSTLTDPRGWQGVDHVRFVGLSPKQVDMGARPDLRITLASPDTIDRLCAPLETRGQVSCHNAGRVALNLRRWVLGAEAYGTDVTAYRTYLVNHEVGHGIGHAHAYCGGAGKVAPVMMQQTYGLKGCTAWNWPSPKPA